MPKEAISKAPKRWEGTHTYAKGNLNRKRTVAQIQEEAARRIQADREKRRIGVEKLRRNSIAGFPAPCGQPDREEAADEVEEVFFDANGDEMTGSNKKKKHNSGATRSDDSPPTPEPMEQQAAGRPPGVDPAMLELLMSIKKDINETTTAAVGRINSRIDENARAIEKAGADTTEEIRKLRQHVDDSQAKFEERITRQLEDRNGEIERRLVSLETRKPTLAASSNADTGATHRQQDAYAKARRALKMWPVHGPDLEDSVKMFLKNKLKIDDDRIRSLGYIETKPAAGKAARERNEVLATFDNRDDRDYVKSMGFNLASDRGAGMSIHVPGHLLDNLYALNSIGYNIRLNQEGVKRSVKFDDSIQDIFLDIYIGGNWKRILPAEARSALKASPAAALGTSSSRGIQAEDLISLVKGDAVPGLTSVVVPADSDSDVPAPQ